MYLNQDAEKKNTFDAIVVGTGISGGWAAKELTEKGLKTLVLERGRMVKHPDYPTATKNPWDFENGGRSLMWGRQSYRFSQLDFEANAKDGIAIDWPVRYNELAPWYDKVEQFIGVSGQVENLPNLPDGKFLPPMELNCVELDLKKAVKDKLGRLITIG